MLNVGVIGLGNTGGQISSGGKTKYDVLAAALNSSSSDISTIRNIDTLIVGDRKGSGKDRNVAKGFIQKGIKDILAQDFIIDLIENSDVIFIPSSGGGGTGSGQAPVLANILSVKYPNKLFVVIGVAPSLKESAGAQQNFMEYMTELMNFQSTYMLYDNGKYDHLPTSQALKAVNDEIIEDMMIVAGLYQHATEFTDIDDKDSATIIRTPGRMVVAKYENFNEKDLDIASIDHMLMSNLSKGAHAELDRDQIIKRFGIITNLSEKINSTFDVNVPKLKELVGEPADGFEHIYINKPEEVNRVMVIMSGLSVPDDRLLKVQQRITEATELLLRTKQSSILGNNDNSALDAIRGLGKGKAESQDIDDDFLNDIFSQYTK